MGGPGMTLRNLSHTRVTLTILWERVSICARIPYSCFFECLYKVDDTVTVVLIMHSNPLCNDDCSQDNWVIISIS